MCRDVVEVIALFCFGLILFTWGLSHQEIVGFDSRFYLFAQEMFRYGPSAFPTTYHQPYPDYPASSTLVIYLFSKWFGGLNKLTAVFPTAIMAAVTVCATYRIGSLQSKRWGLTAIFFLFLTLSFLKTARAISLDMYPTAITALCFYLVYSADRLRDPARVQWIFPLFVAGFIFRGPIGLVLPTGVVCVYYLLDINIKKFFSTGLIAFILLFICSSILFLLAYHTGGIDFIHAVLRMEVSGRLGNLYMPRYYYFTQSLSNYAICFPLAWLVMLGVAYYALRAREYSQTTQFMTKLFGWLLVILIGMSIPDDKKDRYILAMVPAIALISAYVFAVPQPQKYFKFLRAALVSLFTFLPGIFFVITLALFFYLHHKDQMVTIDYRVFYLFLLALQIGTAAIYFRATRDIELRDMFLLGLAALALIVLNFMVIEPAKLFMDNTHAFVVAIEAQRAQQHAQLVFYKEKPDGTPIKYIINMPQFQQPIFLNTPEQLHTFSAPAIFITSADYFAAIPIAQASHLKLVTKGELGHVPVVVFTQNSP